MKTISKLIFILSLCSTVASIAQTSWTPSSENMKMFIYPLTTDVGIGTDNPSSKLEVNTNIWQSPFNVNINNESKLYVGHSGFVGIGTNSPLEKLQVNGNILTPTGGIALGHMYDSGDRLRFSLAPGNFAMIDYEPNLFIRAGNTNANTVTNVMVLKQNGNIGIGGYPSDSYKLDVLGSSRIHVPTSSSTINAFDLEVQSFHTPENSINSSFFKIRDVESGKTQFVVRGDGNVGIGTSSPTATLDIFQDFEGSPSNTEWNSTNAFQIRGVDQALYMGINSTIHMSYIQSVDMGTAPSSLLLNARGGNVGINTANPQYSLDVYGTIRAKEVLVNSYGGADFVFEKNYKLKPIQEISEFVKENKHLPEIPSAAEMESNGVNMGELQIKLLQKVEELTLYLVQQDLMIKEQQAKIQELEVKLNKK